MNPKAPQELEVDPYLAAPRPLAVGELNGTSVELNGGPVPVRGLEDSAPAVYGIEGTGPEAGGISLRRVNLRRLLFAVDGVAASLGWVLGFVLPLLVTRPATEPRLWAAVAVGGLTASLAAMAAQRLYRARSCAVWATEVRRVGRAAAAGVGAGAVLAFALSAPHAAFVLVVTLPTLVLSLVVGRAGYRAWLAGRRRAGHHSRGLVLVGADEDALVLQDVLREQPELGFRITGLVSEPAQAVWAEPLEVPWLGPIEQAEAAVRRVDATGAVVMTNAVGPTQLNALARSLPRAGLHLHLAHGLHGIAQSRLHTVPMGYEPLLYVEPVGPRRRGSVAAKRTMDVAFGIPALVLAIPLLLGAMLAIKIEDGGPVLFRQTRVGLSGRRFQILKLRTMRVDAEARLAEVRGENRRSGGPLFKMADDPRVTRIGRLLRATSFDELPQLVNVLRGQMSLVGPRPALVEEHEAFDPALKQRNDVPPGMTGLWQVEARDNPTFGPYRRLDLYYVENWSIGLDLAILAATGVEVLGRVLLALAGRARRRRRLAATLSDGKALPAVLE